MLKIIFHNLFKLNLIRIIHYLIILGLILNYQYFLIAFALILAINFFPLYYINLNFIKDIYNKYFKLILHF